MLACLNGFLSINAITTVNFYFNIEFFGTVVCMFGETPSFSDIFDYDFAYLRDGLRCNTHPSFCQLADGAQNEAPSLTDLACHL